MSIRWLLYVGAFIVGITLVVVGLIQANAVITLAGVIIGFALFLARKYVQ